MQLELRLTSSQKLCGLGYFGPVDIIFRYATTPKDTMTMEILRHSNHIGPCVSK